MERGMKSQNSEIQCTSPTNNGYGFVPKMRYPILWQVWCGKLINPIWTVQEFGQSKNLDAYQSSVSPCFTRGILLMPRSRCNPPVWLHPAFFWLLSLIVSPVCISLRFGFYPSCGWCPQIKDLHLRWNP